MFNTFYNEIFESNRYIIFIFLIVITILTNYINQHILITEEHYYQFFQDQLDQEQVSRILQFQNKWSLVRYFFIPVFFLLKFSVVSLWLLTGIIFFGYKISFKRLFHVVMVAEIIWLLPAVFTIFWFSIIKPDFSLQEMNNFQFLSLIHFFDASGMEEWITFTLKSINIYVFIYVVLLAAGIHKLIRINFSKALKFTFLTFFFGYFLWIVIIDFITINLTLKRYA